MHCIHSVQHKREDLYKILHIDCVVRPNAEQLTDCVIAMLNNILEWIPPNPENVLSSEDFSKTSGESDGSDPVHNQTGYDINDGNLTNMRICSNLWK